MFVRKKKIKGRYYFYLVQSTRIAPDKWKKIERYIGLNPPTKNDLKKYEHEFDNVKGFLEANKEKLEKIKNSYNEKIKNSTKDERFNFENEMITKFTYDTSRIEGSSLTYKDTKMLLQEGISPSQKPLRDVKEAENHKKAFIYTEDSLSKDITREFILKLHNLLKENVTEDAGKFRYAQVRVGSFISIKASMVKSEIENLISWYKKNRKLHPLELAAVFHCIFERIHPFFDGNGRVGRLLMNFILMKNMYPVIIIQNINKRRYYTALRRADNENYFFMIKYLFYELEAQAREYMQLTKNKHI